MGITKKTIKSNGEPLTLKRLDELIMGKGLLLTKEEKEVLNKERELIIKGRELILKTKEYKQKSFMEKLEVLSVLLGEKK